MTDEPNGGSEDAVSQGDVSVHRTVETDGTGVIGTVELSSGAAEPVLVEVVEVIPDDLPVESAGFKPEAMPDGKEVTDDRLVLEQAVGDEPEEVVYGLMLSEPVETVSLDAPVVESVEPVAGDGREPGERGANAGEDNSAGAADEPGEEPPSLSLSEPTDLADAGENGAAASAEGSDATEPSASVEPDVGVVSEEGATAGADGETDSDSRRSVDIRLDRLSARVEEFAAYAESLGTLVDEHGTPPEFIDRFDRRIDEVDDRVASVRGELSEEVDEVRGDVGEVEDAVADVEGDVAGVEDDVDALAADVDSLDEEVAALREDLDEVSASMARVREETATLREELRELQAARGSLTEVLAEWASPADGVESDAEAGSGPDGSSVVSDGGTTADDRDEYTPAVTPVDPDD